MRLTWKNLQRRTLLKLTNTKKIEQHFYGGPQNKHEH